MKRIILTLLVIALIVVAVPVSGSSDGGGCGLSGTCCVRV